MAWRRPGLFQVVSVLAAALFLWLFRTLFFAPAELCQSFDIVVTEGIAILARRASVLMLGFAALLLAARNAPASPVRRAISLAVAVTFAGFAAVGIYELLRGAAKPDVWAVVAVELAFAAAFSTCWVLDGRPAGEPNPGAGQGSIAPGG